MVRWAVSPALRWRVATAGRATCAASVPHHQRQCPHHSSAPTSAKNATCRTEGLPLLFVKGKCATARARSEVKSSSGTGNEHGITRQYSWEQWDIVEVLRGERHRGVARRHNKRRQPCTALCNSGPANARCHPVLRHNVHGCHTPTSQATGNEPDKAKKEQAHKQAAANGNNNFHEPICRHREEWGGEWERRLIEESLHCNKT